MDKPGFMSEQKRLKETLRRFRPIVGEEPHRGKWRGDFFPDVYTSDDVMTTYAVKRLLLDAGIAEANIMTAPANYSDLSSGKREFIIISDADYKTFETYINNKCKPDRGMPAHG